MGPFTRPQWMQPPPLPYSSVRSTRPGVIGDALSDGLCERSEPEDGARRFRESAITVIGGQLAHIDVHLPAA
jgi:hypothetical protein